MAISSSKLKQYGILAYAPGLIAQDPAKKKIYGREQRYNTQTEPFNALLISILSYQKWCTNINGLVKLPFPGLGEQNLYYITPVNDPHRSANHI